MQSKWMLKSFIAAVGISGAAAANASLIGLDSGYGEGSITLDSNTGLEWLDLLVTITYTGTTSTCCNSYNTVMNELGAGGIFEGFRYATRSEVETLLYASAGFDPVTTSPGNTPTQSDADAAVYLESFLGATKKTIYGPYWSSIIDAVFDDENPDTAIGKVLIAAYGGNGDVQMDYPIRFGFEDGTATNSAPYGHFLVRDSAVKVDEPAGFSLLALCMAGLGSILRRSKKSEALSD